ncbi:MAG TPA: efflux RND transporter periplasmic adaptor subunit [Gemmatimonadaceae bacterium]
MHPRSHSPWGLPLAAFAPLALFLLAGCFSDAAATERHTDSEPRVAIVVRAATPVMRRMMVAASGTVEPRATSDVAFEVPGKLVTVAVDEGDRLTAGQLLAAVDRTNYALALEQAQLTAQRASDEARRARILAASGAVAPNDLEKAVNAEAQANVALAMAEKRLHDTRLVSPLSGIVARRTANRGETVPAGAALFTIVDIDTVRARVAVPESDVGVIATGAVATLTVPSLGDTTFTGHVRLVGVAADKITRTFAVEISVPNTDHRLKAGMVVETSIETPNKATRLTVPVSAIVHDAEGATQLFIYESNEQRVHTRRVTPGVIAGSEVEITSGLAEGELVVIGGQQQLREGMPARLTSTSHVQGAALGSGR